MLTVFKIKSVPKKYDIIVDGILSKPEGERWLELSKYFKNVCLICSGHFLLKAKKTDFFLPIKNFFYFLKTI